MTSARLLLILICLAAALLLIILVTPVITGRDLATTAISDEIIFYSDEFAVVSSFDNIGENQADLVEERLTTLHVPSSQEFRSLRNVCVLRLFLREQAIYKPPFEAHDVPYEDSPPPEHMAIWNRERVYEFADLCLEREMYSLSNIELEAKVTSDTSSGKGLTWRTGALNPVYYFPLDALDLDISVALEITGVNESNETETMLITPTVHGWVSAPKWEERITRPAGQPNRVKINLVRPFSYRALAAILLGSMFVFTFALIFIKETGSFLEVAIGILLGLWGVQDVLIPPDLGSKTLIDSCVLALYVFFAFAIFVRLGIRLVWRWLGNLDYEGTGYSESIEIPVVRIAEDSPLQINVCKDEQQIKGDSLSRFQKASLLLLGALVVLVGLLHIRKSK